MTYRNIDIFKLEADLAGIPTDPQFQKEIDDLIARHSNK
jgi:hypothetical protein